MYCCNKFRELCDNYNLTIDLYGHVSRWNSYYNGSEDGYDIVLDELKFNVCPYCGIKLASFE